MPMRCDKSGYEFVRFRFVKAGRYGVRLYRGDPDRPVVLIVTDPPGNPGPSSVNGAERIADVLCERYGIDPETLLYVDHHVAGRHRHEGEEFYRVAFAVRPDGRHRDPSWYVVGREHVERWIGQRLCPLPR